MFIYSIQENSIYIFYFIIFFIFFYIIAYILYPLIFKYFILKLFHSTGLYIQFKGKGFIHPFYFKAKNIYVKFYCKDTIDNFELKCDKINFRIEILPLLIGKVVLKNIHLYNPYLYYENKLNSFLKIHLLPEPQKVILKNLNIYQGKISVIDYLLPGPYKLQLYNIFLKNAYMDLSRPVSIIFFIEKGQANIDKGIIEAKTNFKNGQYTSGSLTLKNIKWIDVMGISIPFINTKFDLHVFYTHYSRNKTSIKGSLYLTGSSEHEKTGIPFNFDIVWKNYKLPLDLALQNLIEKIFETVQPTIIEKGLLVIGKEVFDRIKKTPDFK